MVIDAWGLKGVIDAWGVKGGCSAQGRWADGQMVLAFIYKILPYTFSFFLK